MSIERCPTCDQQYDTDLREDCPRCGPRIVTHFDPKPIPVRLFDWSATFDGYEPGDPIGYGATEEAAIADLKADLEEAA